MVCLNSYVFVDSFVACLSIVTGIRMTYQSLGLRDTEGVNRLEQRTCSRPSEQLQVATSQSDGDFQNPDATEFIVKTQLARLLENPSILKHLNERFRFFTGLVY